MLALLKRLVGNADFRTSAGDWEERLSVLPGKLDCLWPNWQGREPPPSLAFAIFPQAHVLIVKGNHLFGNHHAAIGNRYQRHYLSSQRPFNATGDHLFQNVSIWGVRIIPERLDR